MTVKAKQSWIDISVPLKSGMAHWPGDSPVSIERVRDMDKGERVNLSVISMGVHSGPHVDAPIHFVQRGQSIDSIPLDTLVGRARVIEIKDQESIKPDELAGHRIRRGERILFKTENSSRVWKKDDFAERTLDPTEVYTAPLLAGLEVPLDEVFGSPS